MSIDWAALGIVAVVSVAATLAFVVLLALGVRCLSSATVSAAHDRSSRSSRSVLSAGYAALGLAGTLVVFCLYLIVPQFH